MSEMKRECNAYIKRNTDPVLSGGRLKSSGGKFPPLLPVERSTTSLGCYQIVLDAGIRAHSSLDDN